MGGGALHHNGCPMCSMFYNLGQSVFAMCWADPPVEVRVRLPRLTRTRPIGIVRSHPSRGASGEQSRL
jgi:hypothetical protein